MNVMWALSSGEGGRGTNKQTNKQTNVLPVWF